MKSVILFLATFLVGAALAFATRTALHDPYAAPAPGDTKLQIGTPPPAPKPVVDPHAGHTATAPAAVVNTICAICSMDVDPDLKPATYQGKLVGFGCAACPAKFAKDPDRYGPSALRNEVVKN
ncbi:MAG: hypothetical protein H2172_05865 [Opitutus sp.]|nr:hypothetical protein [Opitutus sp.]MCS6247446.1 hypothetical protein [Opitutus sp.]MCS6279114.1 hypothetical protein [Opitutus sp.]MCS6298551.1 hypothetical protein [Opitutus sp.]